MYQADRSLYLHIVGFIQMYRAKPNASDDELLIKMGLGVSQFNELLDGWSAGMDIDQLRYFVSRHYIRQQFALGDDAMRSSSPAGNAAMLNLKVFSNTVFVRKAKQMCLSYGVVNTLFGDVLFGFTEEGLCHLTFHDACREPEAVLLSRWSVSQLVQDQAVAKAFAERIFNFDSRTEKISAWTYGTDFQLKVWQTLLQLPSGFLLNYQQLAAKVGSPRAARAVGTTMANNHLSWLIPCHRVLRQSGDFGQYGGGVERKMAMVAYEASRLGQKA